MQNFGPGDQILELGCGTGEDAIWLAERGMRVIATDASEAMLSVARQKALSAGLKDTIQFFHLDLNSAEAGLPSPKETGRFDGIVANFGVINCLEDRQALARAMAAATRQDAKIVLTVMGPVCLWEIVWHLAHGDLRRALRRFRGGAKAHVGGGEMIRVWYPSANRLDNELRPAFRMTALQAIGALLPPSYLSRWLEARPTLFAGLRKLDRKIATRRPWPWFSDHYTMTLVRQ